MDNRIREELGIGPDNSKRRVDLSRRFSMVGHHRTGNNKPHQLLFDVVFLCVLGIEAMGQWEAQKGGVWSGSH